MFVLSKIYLFVTNPGFWLMLLLAGGVALLWTRWQWAGRRILTAVVLFIVAIAVVPVGGMMIAVLEERFPPVRGLDGAVDGIVVLGGTVNQFVSAFWGQPALSDGAERLTETVALARRHPSARIVFTGGSGAVLDQEMKETEVARLFFRQMGLDPERILFESESRNTYENAVYTRALIKPAPGERWLLVTSAAHMPRSVGAFRAAGWALTPYPVDYQTVGLSGLRPSFDMIGGLASFSSALRECMALAVYRALGRTKTLFPAPDDRRPAEG
ncbi:MAG: YdcF family protein [Alphaproteobacteria bacterium]|nr:YdcF family protein [Alphaproteobacteria bacterium]